LGGGGRGWRHRFFAADETAWAQYRPTWSKANSLSREEEGDLLKTQVQNLQETLQRINSRIDELEKLE
jgi:hypothetical protein